MARSSLRLLHIIFHKFVTELWPLIYAEILFLLNILRTDIFSPLYMHSYWQDLAWDCYMSFFAHWYQSFGPWFVPKFHFPSISWETIDRMLQNFRSAFILARSSLGLLHIIFRIIVSELSPFIYTKILFLLNTLRTNQFSPNLIYAFILARSSLGLLHVIGWLVGFVALRPKSTAMVIAGRSVHLTTLFPGQAWTSG